MSFRDKLITLITTFFGAGFLPFIPGTFGSLAGVIVYYFVKNNAFLYAFVMLSFLVAGLVFSQESERIFNKKDARFIVIDEVVGILISLAFLPYSPKLVILGFLLFRLLDTLKPYPAYKIQNLHGSIGIMGDDIVAAIYTNIILQSVLRLLSLIAS